MFDFKDDEIFILGGSGPIGRALQDRLPRAFAPTHNYCDLLYDLNRFRSLLDQIRPRVVFNLLGKTINMAGNIKYAADIFYENTIMNMNALQLCAAMNIPKVVSVLPSCAYPDKEVLKEEDFWCDKSHISVEAHGMARRNTLMYARQLHRQYNFNHITVVLNNIIGEWDSVDPNKTKFAMGVIARMVEAHKNGAPVFEIWGSGKPFRSLLYSGDAAEGLIRAAHSYNDCMEPLNITNNEELSIYDYVLLVKDVIGYKGEIVCDTSKQDGQTRKMLDGAKMRHMLEWEPTTTIREAVAKTVDWYVENY